MKAFGYSPTVLRAQRAWRVLVPMAKFGRAASGDDFAATWPACLRMRPWAQSFSARHTAPFAWPRAPPHGRGCGVAGLSSQSRQSLPPRRGSELTAALARNDFVDVSAVRRKNQKHKEDRAAALAPSLRKRSAWVAGLSCCCPCTLRFLSLIVLCLMSAGRGTST